MDRKIFYLGILLTFIVSLLFRIYPISEKTIFTHDETISYLAASGNQGTYYHLIHDKKEPYGGWAPVAEWKRLYKQPEELNFQTVSHDLGQYDIHPPLYYWLLHLAVYFFGVHMWTGATLSLVLFSLTFLVVFLVASRLLDDRKTIFFTLFIWLMSPAVATEVFEARHHSLTALLGFILIYLVIRIILEDDRKGFKYWAAGVFFVSLLGMLTNYMFALVIASVSMLLIYKWIVNRERRYLATLVAAGLGALTMPAVHPAVFNVFANTKPFQGETNRLLRTFDGYLGFFSSNPFTRYVTMLLVAVLLVSLAVSWYKKKVSIENVVKNERTFILLFLFVVIAGLNHLVYILEFTPPHASGAQYWNTFWPLFAMLVAKALVCAEYYLKPVMRAAFLVLVLVSSSAYIYNSPYKIRTWADEFIPMYREAAYLVTDQTKRGYLPALIHNMKSDQYLYVGSSKDIQNITIEENFDIETLMYITGSKMRKVRVNNVSYSFYRVGGGLVFGTDAYMLMGDDGKELIK